MKNHKSGIPPASQGNKTCPAVSALFGFDKDTTLVSFVPKKSKSVSLISTMHHDDKIDDETGKPYIILYHSQSKGVVDTVNQMCHHYSMQRKTRWSPSAYFVSLLNIGGLNSLTTYIYRFPQ